MQGGRRIDPGDILVFKGQGIVFEVLSRILKLFEPNWSRWGWHLAIAVEYHKGKGWLIAEALYQGVTLSWLDQKRQSFKIIRWLKREIHSTEIRRFMAGRAGCKYDVLAYALTILQLFLPRFPRFIDRHYTCWELVFEFCRAMGKPVQKIHRFPLLTDLIEAHREEQLAKYQGNMSPFYNSIVPYIKEESW